MSRGNRDISFAFPEKVLMLSLSSVNLELSAVEEGWVGDIAGETSFREILVGY